MQHNPTTARSAIVRTRPKKMSYMRKRRTAARMRAKGFPKRVIKEQVWGNNA